MRVQKPIETPTSHAPTAHPPNKREARGIWHTKPRGDPSLDALENERLQQLGQALLDGLAVELVRGREELVVGRPWGVGLGLVGVAVAADQPDGLQPLEGRHPALRALPLEVGQHRGLHFGVLAEELVVVEAEALRGRPLAQLGAVGLHERHRAVHGAVTVAQDAAVERVDEDGLGVLLLHALDRNVLATLCECRFACMIADGGGGEGLESIQVQIAVVHGDAC